jgi:hypothetical protein
MSASTKAHTAMQQHAAVRTVVQQQNVAQQNHSAAHDVLQTDMPSAGKTGSLS